MSDIRDYGDDGNRDYFSEMLEDLAITDDAYATDLLFTGWFDPDTDIYERAEAREMFLDYMDMDVQDFDWETWREFYGEVGA